MLSRRMMIQALADRYAGLTPKYRARQFGEPFRSLWLTLETLGAAEVEREWLAILLKETQGKQILDEIKAAIPGNRGLIFPPLSAIAADLPPITWLWSGWIPRG